MVDYSFEDIFFYQQPSNLNKNAYITKHCIFTRYIFQLLLSDPNFSYDPISKNYMKDSAKPSKHSILNFFEKRLPEVK